MKTFLLIGLGNPGKKYENTPHNIGFMMLDAFAKKHAFPAFRAAKKLNAEISEDVIGDAKVILAKPQTFMNESGHAVQKLITSYQLPVTNIIVIHDDIDIPLGELKIAVGRGSAGHKGVASIIQHLGTQDFARVRVGIKPADRALPPRSVDAFVLKPFSKAQHAAAQEGITKAVTVLDTILEKGIEETMNTYNTKIKDFRRV